MPGSYLWSISVLVTATSVMLVLIEIGQPQDSCTSVRTGTTIGHFQSVGQSYPERTCLLKLILMRLGCCCCLWTKLIKPRVKNALPVYAVAGIAPKIVVFQTIMSSFKVYFKHVLLKVCVVSILFSKPHEHTVSPLFCVFYIFFHGCAFFDCSFPSSPRKCPECNHMMAPL